MIHFHHYIKDLLPKPPSITTHSIVRIKSFIEIKKTFLTYHSFNSTMKKFCGMDYIVLRKTDNLNMQYSSEWLSLASFTTTTVNGVVKLDKVYRNNTWEWKAKWLDLLSKDELRYCGYPLTIKGPLNFSN